MNELISMGLIFAVVFVIGGAYALGSTLMKAIIDSIVGFIRWRRTMSGKTKDVYYHRNKD